MLKNRKKETVERLEKMAKSYNAVGIVDMHKLPARQLQKIKKSLSGKAVLAMSRRSLIKRALEAAGKNELITKLAEAEEPALIFTNENPFRIYRAVKESKSPASAKAGDVAKADITVSKGATQLPPGPAISTLQAAGLKTTVQDGKIAVLADKIVLKSGEKVTPQLANMFSLLKMEPMEIRLGIRCIFEGGVIYGKDVLDVDVSEYIGSLKDGVNSAVNLSLNSGYLTKFTAPLAITKAFLEAKSLCIQSGVFEKDAINDMLAHASIEAMVLGKKTGS